MPAAAAAGLRELGYSLWFIPQADATSTRRLVEEFPPDLVILPLRPASATAVGTLRERLPGLRVLASTETDTDLRIEHSWADFVVPRDADPVFWMLALMTLGGPEPTLREAGEQEPRSMLTLIDAAHRALGSIDPRAAAGDALLADLRSRLEKSFELLLRMTLERLERGVEGFAGRSARVARLSRRLAEELGASEEEAAPIELAGLLHDVGMHLVTPSQTLSRKGPLHEAEWEVMRNHPMASAAIVAPLRQVAPATTAIREHHERLDGSGYPMGKSGDQVSLGARIIAVVDAYEAMTHSRPHRSATGSDEALTVLEEQAGEGRLDPTVCAALRSLLGSEDPATPE